MKKIKENRKFLMGILVGIILILGVSVYAVTAVIEGNEVDHYRLRVWLSNKYLVTQERKKFAATIGVVAKIEGDNADEDIKDIQKGDVNRDNYIDVKDARETLSMAVGSRPITSKDLEIADFNGNKMIESSDAIEVLKLYVNKE